MRIDNCPRPLAGMKGPPLVRVALIVALIVPLIVVLSALVRLGPLPACAANDASDAPVGPWRAWIQSPGGQLPFGLDIQSHDGELTAWILNPPERLAVPQTSWREGELHLDIDHYDSAIRARWSPDGRSLVGRWTKRKRGDEMLDMPFAATPGDERRFLAPAESVARAHPAPGIDGRWSVDFASEELAAVAIFENAREGVRGTFLTLTGDFRYLSGNYDDGRLRLSCFDGAHAFLFDAWIQDDGTLRGDFWSSDSWHEAWVAHRDEKAALPDAFAQTRWTGAAELGELRFPDLDGRLRALDDPAFAGRARIIEVFGSWCPNCNDSAAYLTELHERYGERGLSILGLAFEYSEDFERNAVQLRRFVKRHDIRYPVLVAGFADKARATQTLPVLDRVRSYPTAIFIDESGQVRAIHSGYAGPATGSAHAEMRASYEALLDELLGVETP